MHLCGPWGHAPGSWNVVASLPVYAPANIELNSVQGAERLISLPPLFSFYQVTGFFTCKSCLCLYFFNGLTLLSFSFEAIILGKYQNNDILDSFS